MHEDGGEGCRKSELLTTLAHKKDNRMMKKVLALVAAAILATGAAHAGRVQFKGDTMIVVEGGDTTSITGAQAKQRLAKILDDTVVGKVGDTGMVPDSDDPDDVVKLDRADYNSLRWRADQYDNLRDRQDLVAVISVVSILSLLTLIIAVTWFVVIYKNRRNRYKMIEKAIENNYKLPDSEVDYVMAPQNFAVPAQPVAPHGRGSSFAANFAPGALNWNLFYRSFLMIIVGFALVMFFALADAEQMAALSSIVMFAGLGKAFIIYQNQRNAMMQSQKQHASNEQGNAAAAASDAAKHESKPQDGGADQ